MKFVRANEEFESIANELFSKHSKDLGLFVHPSKVMFLRSGKIKKNAYAYCKMIHGEYELLTDKRFFIVIVNENFDSLKTDEEKKYVILHELKHLHYDDETGKYGLIKHSLQDFHQLLVNPSWNLQLVKNEDEEDETETENNEKVI